MAIRWQIPFRSLRAGRVYTVNIHDDDYSGSALQLTGAAVPFETQEDDDADFFKPVRNQSGYLRFVDTGFLSDGVTPFDWRDLIPTTDVDRAVTLTHDENGTTVVDWIGFMQAQNFGSQLYEKPLEREYPVQCPLSVMSCKDVSTEQKDIRNFAYLVWYCLNQIPATGRPNQVVVQGGEDAQSWLLKKVDWINFIEQDTRTLEAKAKCDVGMLMEYVCNYWGWTARTSGQTLYLTCADDSLETNALVLSYADLTSMAAGTSSGTIASMFTDLTVGDIYASTNNIDYQERGPNKAIVRVDSQNDAEVLAPFDDKLAKAMNDADWYDGYIENDGSDYWHYSKDVTSVERYDLIGESVLHASDSFSGEAYYPATFNILARANGADAGYGYSDVGNVIHIKRTYDGTTFMTLETIYEHCFSAGYFRLLADTYRKGKKYEEGGWFAGNPEMKMRLGVGNDRSSAKWWNGQSWQSSICIFTATIGNKKPELFTRVENGTTLVYESSIILTETMYGRLFVEFLGTDDSRVSDINGQKSFDLYDFRVEYRKNDSVTKRQFPNSGWWDIRRNNYTPEMEYEAKNESMLKDERTVNTPFGSNEGIESGYPILMNADGTYMTAVPYGDASERPEVHLVNRVVDYWAKSKRRVECELLAHDGSSATVANGITPRSLVTIDGTKMHPIAISRKWRDDVVSIHALEVSGGNWVDYLVEGDQFITSDNKVYQVKET